MNNTKTQATLHLIADESLGGLLREYTETDRKASVGDYVYVSKIDESEVSEIAKVVNDDYGDDGGDCIQIDRMIRGENLLLYYTAEDVFRTLSPTDIIHVDGERFRMVDRKAEVGEKVVAIESDESNGYKYGDVLTVAISCESGGIFTTGGVELVSYEYRVIEPVESLKEAEALTEVTTAEASEQVIATVDETEASPSVLDMLANLSQRIVALEAENKRQNDEIDTLHRNNVKLGEELEHLKAEAKAPATTEVDAVDFSGFVDAVAAKVADRIAKGLSR